MINIVRKLGEEGKSIIVSSHILYEIERMADQVVVLHQGKRLAGGKIRDIREMIYDVPHTIKLSTDRPRELAKLLISEDYVSVVNVVESEGNKDILVKTNNPDSFYSNITDVVINNKIRLRHLSSVDDDLESVFHYLVGKRSFGDEM